jgi:hypothetical protein
MPLFRRHQQLEEKVPGCLRCHILDIPKDEKSPVAWWFLPGCFHNGWGHTAVCDPCKQQIDAGNRVPGLWNCRCGAAPVLIPVSEGEVRPPCLAEGEGWPQRLHEQGLWPPPQVA